MRGGFMRVDIYMKLDLRTWEIKADGRRDLSFYLLDDKLKAEHDSTIRYEE